MQLPLLIPGGGYSGDSSDRQVGRNDWLGFGQRGQSPEVNGVVRVKCLGGASPVALLKNSNFIMQFLRSEQERVKHSVEAVRALSKAAR